MNRLNRLAGIAIANCLCVFAFGGHRQTDPKITLTAPATNAAVALQKLGNAAHVTLLTSPQTANEIVTFRFKDVPLSEAMKRIADAVDGSWKQEGDAYRLIRTADQQNTEVKKEFDQTVETIRKSIQKRMDYLQKQQPWSEAEADALAIKVQALIKSFNPNIQNGNWYQQGTLLSSQAPIGRALTRAAALMDPVELAGLRNNIKTVWSTSPTPTQRPMPREILPIIDDFVRWQSDWAASIEKHHLAAPTRGDATYWVGGFGDFQEDAAGRVAVVLLSAIPFGSMSGFNLELSAYNDKGKRVAQANTMLGNDYADIFAERSDSSSGNERKITLDADALALVDLRGQSRARTKVLSPELIARLTHPEQFDPLSFLMSSKLLQAADIRGVNMVAQLTDNMFFADMSMSTKDVSVGTFLARVGVLASTSDMKDGWLVLKAKRPAESRANQANRIELGKYLRRVAMRRPLSIDELAGFAVSLPEEMENYMPRSLATFVSPVVEDYVDPNMLRFYGLLTSDQKARMSNGGLPFSALSEDEIEYVNRMLYGQNSNLQYQPPRNQQGVPDRVDYDLYYNGIYHETTESLPNGIPPQGLIKLRVENSQVVIAGDSNSERYGTPGRTMDANNLAWQKYGQEHPDIFPWMANEQQKVNLSRIQFGRRLKMDFTFQFTPALSIQQSLEDKSQGDFQSMTLNDLPDDFKKQFQQAYDSYVKSYANVKPGQFNGGIGSGPPP